MRHLSAKILCFFIAVVIFVSPLVSMADDFCQCPDCARRTCISKSEACFSEYYSEENRQCCYRDELVSKTPEAEFRPTGDLSTEESGHKSQTESKDCRCDTYLCYDGNALLPVINSDIFSTTDEFHQHTPKVFATSGWVYRTFHPPR